MTELAIYSLPAGLPCEPSSRGAFEDKDITHKPPTPNEYKEKAETLCQSLLTAANSAAAGWRTELKLDIISDDDKVSLIKWMAYIKTLRGVDLSSVSDESGYNAIKWPDVL